MFGLFLEVKNTSKSDLSCTKFLNGFSTQRARHGVLVTSQRILWLALFSGQKKSESNFQRNMFLRGLSNLKSQIWTEVYGRFLWDQKQIETRSLTREIDENFSDVRNSNLCVTQYMRLSQILMIFTNFAQLE